MRISRLIVLAWIFSILVALPSFVYGGAAESIDGIASQIPTEGAVLVILGFVLTILVELVERLRPTLKPRGWLVMIAAVLGAVEGLVRKLKELALKLQEYSDKVLPQRTKDSQGLIDKKP